MNEPRVPSSIEVVSHAAAEIGDQFIMSPVDEATTAAFEQAIRMEYEMQGWEVGSIEIEVTRGDDGEWQMNAKVDLRAHPPL